MIIRKEIKIIKKNGKNKAGYRSVLNNGYVGKWFHVAVSEANKMIKSGKDINGIKVVAV